ncbi:MAG: XdhC family protein [Flexilinea sp.]|nr:XdhC family protein [Flexilinea sp.]
MEELFKHILYEIKNKHDLILVTLIENDGSAPRKTGAQMLVGYKGLIYGTIGGGAVEKRSIEMAQENLKTEKISRIHAFQLHENKQEDIGMICGGNVTAFFQFIDADDQNWQQLCQKALAQFKNHQGGWFVQNLSGSAPALYDKNFALLAGTPPEDPFPEKNLSGTVGHYFWMPLPILDRVLIFGGGHIAAALVPLLKTVGFRSWVFDDRPEFTTSERFPLAEKCITGDFTRIADDLTVTDQDYVVIMTNGHIHDFEAELHVLRGPFAYLGVIGSKKKTASVNARLRENGISDEQIAKVHAPIGTAIKAVTPEEIAVSIAGELILTRAELREKSAGADHNCPMH